MLTFVRRPSRDTGPRSLPRDGIEQVLDQIHAQVQKIDKWMNLIGTVSE